MSSRIGVGEFFHETNVFTARQTTMADFKAFRLFRGEELIVADAGTRTFTAGMLDRLVQLELEGIPLLAAAALPSGIIEGHTFEKLLEELLQRIADAGPLDGLCIGLHGAAMAEGFDDADGEVLRRIRRQVGPKLPIVATLDLHGNITQAMVDEASILLGTNYYPHTDCYERGQEAVDCLTALIRGDLKPTSHLERLPMMISPSTTDEGPAKELMELCWRLERTPGVIEVQIYHGFPMTDCPDVGVSVLACTNGDAEMARSAARAVAVAAWEARRRFVVPSLAPEEALDEALALIRGQGPVVINECSDNAGGGTPGDGTHLARAMIEADLTNVAFGTIADPDVAAQAHAAGVGATIKVRLGAKVDPLYGRPIEGDAIVRGLSNGRFTSRSRIWGAMPMNLGLTACLRFGGVDVVVVSVPMQVYDDGPFEISGVNVHQMDLIGLKSSQHFRAWWRDVASAIITTDPPGGTSNQLQRLHHKRIQRPIWPLDPDTTYPT